MDLPKSSYESDQLELDTMAILPAAEEECHCDIFYSPKSLSTHKRATILDISIDKYMENRKSKFDKPTLCRITLIRNTINRLQEDIEEEKEQMNYRIDDETDSWDLEEFQEKLNNFECNIDRMMKNSDSSANNSSTRKRMFEEVELEDVFSEFHLPEMLTCMDDEALMVEFQPSAKRLKTTDKKDNF